jgi:hypothetical protein
MNAYDIETRISNEGRVPIAPLVHVHEIRDNGAVMSDDNVKVTAALGRYRTFRSPRQARRKGHPGARPARDLRPCPHGNKRVYCPGHRPGVYGTPAASSCCSNLRNSPSSARSFVACAFSSSLATV